MRLGRWDLPVENEPKNWQPIMPKCVCERERLLSMWLIVTLKCMSSYFFSTPLSQQHTHTQKDNSSLFPTCLKEDLVPSCIHSLQEIKGRSWVDSGESN